MIRFSPIYKEVPWGGSRFKDQFGRRTPEAPVGESWELVSIPPQESRVARGPREGKLLSELWQAGVLGGSATGAFPFLLKWLDTRDKLSVQVHPNAAAVTRLGTGAPKAEAWYVADAHPEASLLIGHYPGLDAATLRQAAAGGTIHKWLYEVRPRRGEMLLVEAGTLHAIGAGYLLLEVQQPSDSTFRVYDWGRVGHDGAPRELHLEEACVAIDFKRAGPPRPQRDAVVGPGFSMRRLLPGSELPQGPLRVIAALEQGAQLVGAGGDETLTAGDVVVAEVQDGPLTLAHGSAVWLSEA